MSTKHTYAIDSKQYTEDLTPMKAILRKCMECRAVPPGSRKRRGLIKDCLDITCPLWPYRTGRKPS